MSPPFCKFIVLLIAVSQVTGDVVYTRCPEGWLAGRGSCYLFDTHLESYERAETFCEHHDGTLVRIDNTQENEFLKRFLQIAGNKDWWIGLNDRFEEGAWSWEMDTSNHGTFTDWFPGQPDDYTGQDCAIYNHVYHYSWTDENCNKDHYSICELKDNTFVDTSVPMVG